MELKTCESWSAHALSTFHRTPCLCARLTYPGTGEWGDGAACQNHSLLFHFFQISLLLSSKLSYLQVERCGFVHFFLFFSRFLYFYCAGSRSWRRQAGASLSTPGISVSSVRNPAFKSGDAAALRYVEANLNKAIRLAKRAHGQKNSGALLGPQCHQETMAGTLPCPVMIILIS